MNYIAVLSIVSEVTHDTHTLSPSTNLVHTVAYLYKAYTNIATISYVGLVCRSGLCKICDNMLTVHQGHPWRTYTAIVRAILGIERRL